MTRVPEFTTAQLMRELLSDPDRKPLLRIVLDLLYLAIYYRTIPRYYFSRYLFRKDRTNIKDYLPPEFLYGMKAKFNEEKVRDVLENKLYFDFFFRQFGVALPKVLMYNHRSVFVQNGQTSRLNSIDEFRNVLHEIISSSKGSIIVKKTYWSYGGDKVYRLTADDLHPDRHTVNDLYEEVIQTGFLFQESVVQHDDLDRLNPSCLNTLRLDTFIDMEGNTEVISAYLRTNIKNQPVDNDPVGGCEIPVDLESGRLGRYGHLTLKTNGLKPLTVHPHTGIHFEGFQVPFFNEAKQLTVHVAGFVPGLRLVGWDIAIGPDGPVLIEGNSDYDIAASDLSYGGYLRNPVFRKVLTEFGYL